MTKAKCGVPAGSSSHSLAVTLSSPGQLKPTKKQPGSARERGALGPWGDAVPAHSPAAWDKQHRSLLPFPRERCSCPEPGPGASFLYLRRSLRTSSPACSLGLAVFSVSDTQQEESWGRTSQTANCSSPPQVWPSMGKPLVAFLRVLEWEIATRHCQPFHGALCLNSSGFPQSGSA